MPEFFTKFLALVLTFLPGSPFIAFINAIDSIPYMAQLNWFFPVSECVAVLEAWLSVIVVFYVYQAIMRAIHVIN